MTHSTVIRRGSKAEKRIRADPNLQFGEGGIAPLASTSTTTSTQTTAPKTSTSTQIIAPTQIIPPKQITGKKVRTIQRRKKDIRKLLLTTQRTISRKIITKGKKFFDVVSGGVLTERSLRKGQEGINKETEIFNKRFGNKELSEKQFKEAQKLESGITQRQSQLNKKRKTFEKSSTAKIRDFVWTTGSLTKGFNFNKAISKNENELRKTKIKLQNLKDKKGPLNKLNRFRLNKLQEGLKKENKNLKDKKVPVILTGDVPLIPGIGLPRNVKLKFIGQQKRVGNKIITDVVFESSQGRIGVARGLTIQKGKKGASIIIGKSGTRGVKFPSAKIKIGRREVFIGLEKSVGIPTSIKVKQTIKLLNAKKSQIVVTKQNLKMLKQFGVGKTFTLRGKKFIRTGVKFPSAKIIRFKARGINVDDFASISVALTKKDLSLIIGKTITGKANKIRFIGLIKGERSLKTGRTIILNSVQKQQYQRALKQVIGVISSSLVKSKSLKGIGRAGTLGIATRTVKQLIRTKSFSPKRISQLKQETIKITTQKFPSPPLKIQKTKQITGKKVRTRSGQKSAQALKTAQDVKQRVKQVVRQISQQKTKQQVRQILRQRSLTRQMLRQVLRQISTQKLNKIARGNLKSIGIRVPPRLIIPIKIRLRKKGKGRKRSKKSQIAFNVFARPLKKKGQKRIPKLIKVNIRPLTKNRAEDLRNFISDQSLSRTAMIKKTRGKPKQPKLKVPSGYAKRTSRKFRTFQIKKRKRVSLSKGKIIEKSRFLLDTLSEKKGITLRRKIAQLKRKARIRKPIKRRVIKRRTKIKIRSRPTFKRKRTLSQPQLKALARGRAIRRKNLKGR